MKKYLLLALLIVVVGSGTASAQTARCDRQCLETVKDLLKGQRFGVFTSWLEKENRQLGDSAAVGIQKIFGKRNALAPKNIRLYLPIVREAFKDKQMITKLENRRPTVTLKLLNSLKNRVIDPELKESIERTIALVSG